MKKILILLIFIIPIVLFSILSLGKVKAQEEGLLFHETFENLASITNNGGTVQGPINFVPGQVGNAADFAGGGKVEYPYQGRFNPQEGRLEFWFKPTQAGGGLFDVGTIGTAESFGVFTNIGRIWVEFDFGAFQVAQPIDTTTAAWHHVKVWWRCNNTASEGNFDAISLDGAPISGRIITNSSLCLTLAATDKITIGWTGFYGFSNATFDELKIYNSLEKPTFQKPQSTGSVKVSSRQLLVNNQPFFVKSVGYQPTPIGLHPNQSDMYCQPEIYNRDIPKLREMNINVIRTWRKVDCLNGSANLAFLDSLWNGGERPIRLIMGFWVNYNENFANSATRTRIKQEFRNYVARYKNHPAVLVWAIGNENNLFTSQDVEFYTLANEMAQEAFNEEGSLYHPVAIVNGEIANIGMPFFKTDDASLSHIDIWGANVYRGFSLGNLYSDFSNISKKPLLLTEYGIDSLNNQNCTEHESVQSQWDLNLFREMVANSQVTVGGSLMEYADEWWKGNGSSLKCLSAGSTNSTHDPAGYSTNAHPDGYSNEEWWGIMAVSDNGNAPDIMTPRQVYNDLKREFFDIDRDGFPDKVENYLGTNLLKSCPNTETANDELVDPWPPDINDNGIVQIDDISFASGRFNTRVGDANYSARAEIASQNGVIGIDDIFGFSSRFNQICPASSASESFIIAGEVTDSQTKKHIQNLTVTLTSPEDPQITQTFTGDKFYYFLNPPTKNLKIEVSAPGYKKEIKHIKPEPNQKSVLLNFELRN